MRYCFFFLYWCLSIFITLGQNFQSLKGVVPQKSLIDSSAISDWYTLGTLCSLSSNGNYFLYSIDNQPKGKSTMVVRSTWNNWSRELTYSQYPAAFFSSNNRYLIFKQEDSLYFWKLGTLSQWALAIRDFQCPSNRWLGYRIKGKDDELIVHDLLTGNKETYEKVVKYWFDPKGTKLLVLSQEKLNSNITLSLKYINLDDGRTITIWGLNSSSNNVDINIVKFDNKNN